MGEVYRARDSRLGRDVAIKVLPADVTADPARLTRFAREARAVAALSHPNVLAIFDVSSEGQPYLVTELLEGETLRARIAHGRLPVGEAVDIVLALAAGLTAAHGRGIIHRDLKPDNIFLTRDGLVKILDFGLAKGAAIAGAEDDMGVTRAPSTLDGMVVGTVGYMAPEQIRGQVVDARTDIFAVGAVLYEMVSGERAFRGDSLADTMSAVLREAPQDLSVRSGMPPGLARIVARCLEKDAERRFQSARDLTFALEPLSTRHAPGAEPVRSQAKSIAVLPFANMSGDPENEFFSDGLAEELINALARLQGLRVAARTSSFRFRGQHADVREIGRQLNVDHVLEGSVRRAGNRLRITAQLINVHDGYHLWSERYDREMADVFDIQDEITAAIVKTIAPTLMGEDAPVAKRHTQNVEAYELYLRGRHLWYMRTPQSVRAAMNCYARAIGLDGDYALAHAGMAEAHSTITLYGFVPLPQSRASAEASAKRALALAPELAEPHVAMGIYKLWASGEWNDAWRDLSEGLAIQHSSNTEAYLAACLAGADHYAEARALVVKSAENDPATPFVHASGAAALYVSGAYEESQAAGERSLALHPDFALALYITGFALCELGRFDRAIAHHERLVAISNRQPIFVGMLAYALGRAGRGQEVTTLLNELRARQATEYVISSTWLLIWTGLADRDRMYDSLVDCVAEGVNGMAVKLWLHPFVESLAREARFAEMFRRLNMRTS